MTSAGAAEVGMQTVPGGNGGVGVQTGWVRRRVRCATGSSSVTRAENLTRWTGVGSVGEGESCSVLGSSLSLPLEYQRGYVTTEGGS